MKNVLVTGGAGFIGSHLCHHLIEKGNFVYCVDNLHEGSLDNIKGLINHERFKFYHHDITNAISLDCDIIFNLACPASPINYQRNPIKTFKTNVIGTLNMIELALKNNAILFQASTSEVYGDSLVHPQNEDYWGNVNPIGFRSCYDEGKRAAESILFDYHRVLGLRIKVLRIFNTYGPNMRMHDGRAISNFINQALNNESITIYGNGTQTRSFCYIDDLIHAIFKMMETDDSTTGPINIGNPCETSIIDIATLIVKKCQSKSDIVFNELPKDDPKQRKPDIQRAKEVLNWEPKWSLSDGIEETIKYYRGIRKK